MKLPLCKCASVLILLLSPMAANATLIEYTSNSFGNGQYLTAEVEINGSGPGVYSDQNLGLENFVLSVFDSSDMLLGSLSSPTNTTEFNNYVQIDAVGTLSNWWLYASGEVNAPGDFAIGSANHLSNALLAEPIT